MCMQPRDWSSGRIVVIVEVKRGLGHARGLLNKLLNILVDWRFWSGRDFVDTFERAGQVPGPFRHNYQISIGMKWPGSVVRTQLVTTPPSARLMTVWRFPIKERNRNLQNVQRSARLWEHEQPGGPPALPARLLAPLPGQPVHRSGVLLIVLMRRASCPASTRRAARRRRWTSWRTTSCRTASTR